MIVHGIDIGGSSVKAALVRVNDDHVETIKPTRTTVIPSAMFSEVRDVVLRCVRDGQASRPRPMAVGISTTGRLSATGVVVSCGLIDGYAGVSWPTLVAEEFGDLPVSAINDGWAAALGEFHAGDGTGPHLHAVVGTGVGGGVVIDGELLTGISHVAGRIGHIKVSRAATIVCACGQVGCCETLASAPAVVRYYGASVDRSTGTMTIREVGTLAGAGDPEAAFAFEHAGYWLGTAVGAAINVVNPAVVSLGGGVILASQLAVGPAGNPYVRGVCRGINDACSSPVAAATVVRLGSLGNDAAVLGVSRLAANAAGPVPG